MRFYPALLSVIILLGTACWPLVAQEALIDSLANIDEATLGKVTDAIQDRGEFLLTTRNKYPGNPLASLVMHGAASIPLLVAHLDDDRLVNIKEISGDNIVTSNNEYDFNRRTIKNRPRNVNRADYDGHPSKYQMTVGDLCFVALGQIVNRHFNAVRYQPEFILVINSPSHSRDLFMAARNEYLGFDAKKHLAQLIRDIKEPDVGGRRYGAAVRLSWYYPREFEEFALEQLKMPAYDSSGGFNFVRNELYAEISSEQKISLVKGYDLTPEKWT